MATELKREDTSLNRIEELLGDDGRALLEFNAPKISRDLLHTPGPDFVDRVWANSDRSPAVLRSLQTLFDTGRLRGTGYLSILPVDQGIEHSAGASFAPNPLYFDPENIAKLAIEGGCNAVASTFGVLGSVGRRCALKTQSVIKFVYNGLQAYTNRFDQVLFGTDNLAIAGANGIIRDVEGIVMFEPLTFSVGRDENNQLAPNGTNRKPSKILRQRQRWEYNRDRIFFYFGIGVLSSLCIPCLFLLFNPSSELLKLTAIGVLGGLVRAVMLRMPKIN